MQVVVFGAHDAPRERLALSYTSRRDHLGAECPPLHPRCQRASGERALQGASSGPLLGMSVSPCEAAQATIYALILLHGANLHG